MDLSSYAGPHVAIQWIDISSQQAIMGELQRDKSLDSLHTVCHLSFVFRKMFKWTRASSSCKEQSPTCVAVIERSFRLIRRPRFNLVPILSSMYMICRPVLFPTSLSPVSRSSTLIKCTTCPIAFPPAQTSSSRISCSCSPACTFHPRTCSSLWGSCRSRRVRKA